MGRTLIQIALIPAIILLAGLPAYCCTPAVPLMMAMVGANIIMWSFAGVLIVVLIKCISFPFFAKDLNWVKASVIMFVANIFTSIVGFFIAAFATLELAWLTFWPFFFILSYFIGVRLRKSSVRGLNKLSPSAFAVLMTFLYLASSILYLMATSEVNSPSRSPFVYWILKIVFVFGGIVMGFFITTLFEEWLVAVMARRKAESFLTPVIKTNLIALFVVSVIGAISILPERLHSLDFLVPLLNLFR